MKLKSKHIKRKIARSLEELEDVRDAERILALDEPVTTLAVLKQELGLTSK